MESSFDHGPFVRETYRKYNTAVRKHAKIVSLIFSLMSNLTFRKKTKKNHLRFISLFEEERHTVQQWGAVATSITWASLMKTLISTLCYRRQSTVLIQYACYALTLQIYSITKNLNTQQKICCYFCSSYITSVFGFKMGAAGSSLTATRAYALLPLSIDFSMRNAPLNILWVSNTDILSHPSAVSSERRRDSWMRRGGL